MEPDLLEKVRAGKITLQNVYAILAKDLSPKQMAEIGALLIVAAPVATPESEPCTGY
jgi:hypothetical protein